MRPQEAEEAFQQNLLRQESYFAAVRAAGDQPWFEIGNPKRDEAVALLGLDAEVSEVDLRRAVFLKRWSA